MRIAKYELKAKVNSITKFTLQDHHLSLAARMPVDFEDFDDPYEGTFSVPSKRPFGTKTWSSDIALMMGHDGPGDAEEEYVKWYKENYLRYWEVYLEMQIVMQIALQYVKYPLRPGQVYVRRGPGYREWTLQE